jgi:type VI protein secretion system component VasK
LPLWKRFWLLFTVIWVVVAVLNAGSILAFGDEVEAEKAIRPIIIGIAVPIVLYLVLWAWQRLTRKPSE